VEPWLLGAILALLFVVIFLLVRNGSAEPAEATATALVQTEGEVDLSEVFSAAGISPRDADDRPLVVPQDDGATALVIGDKSMAERWGAIVSDAGPRIEAYARRSSSGVHAGISGAERAGYLVRLHPESAKALKHLKPDHAKDALGYVLGTLRGGDGKYAHVIRIKQVTNLQTMSSGAALLSALAMQAQLDRIERSLAQLQDSVDAIRNEAHDQEDAKRDALEDAYGETYRTARKHGKLTSVQWESLPPVTEAYALRKATLRALERERAHLAQLPKKAKDRALKLDEVSRNLDRLLANLDRDDRLVGQAQVLRLWRMASTKDPSLPTMLEDTRQQVAARIDEREAALTSIEELLIAPDVSSLLQRLRTSRRRRIRRSGHELSWEVRQRRVAMEAATSPQLSVESGRADSLAQAYSLSEQEAAVLTVAQLWMMSEDAELSGSASKQNDFDEFLTAARGALSDHGDPDVRAVVASPRNDFPATEDPLIRICESSGNRVRSLLLLIELAAFHPWSPTDAAKPLKSATAWDKSSRFTSLRRLAGWLTGTSEEDADRVASCFSDVQADAGRGGRNWWVVGGLTAAGVGLGALTGGLAAPAIGAFIGSTVFGLSGAAATSAGLAALGGGSLAAGGFGMAGGTALVASVGGLAGASLLGGGSAAARGSSDEQRNLIARLAIDLIKLQVLARVILIEELHDYEQVTVVVEKLRERRREMDARLAEFGKSTTDVDIDPETVAHDEKAQLQVLGRALDRATDDLLKRKSKDYQTSHRHARN
jgi:hypothetical protein